MNNYYHINTHLHKISQLNIVDNSYIQNMNDNFENRDYIPYYKINKKKIK